MIPRNPVPDPGDAAIGRGTAAALSGAFLALLLVPAAHQAVAEIRGGGGWTFLALFRRAPTAASLKEFEETLGRDSRLGALARERYQSLLTGLLRQGNEKVIVGRQGFLFFRKEVEMASGPGFLSRRSHARRGSGDEASARAASDPVTAIADYGRRLRARGVRLIFIPLPLKPFLYPEHLWPGYPAEAGPAWNPDRARFEEELSRAGVDVLDVTDDLWRAKAEGEVFLRRDTHWTPLGLRAAADRIAGRLEPLLGPPGAAAERRTVTVTNGGDLLRMIDAGAAFPPQTVELLQGPARGDDAAAVLLLGDSFTNVYSRKELDWGEGAGLGEQLAFRLGQPVQVLALNGGGATAVRELLARKPSALAHKKVVVWACSARDLDDESVAWEKVPLPGEDP